MVKKMKLDKKDMKQISGGYVDSLDGWISETGAFVSDPHYVVVDNKTKKVVEGRFSTLEQAQAADEQYHLGAPPAKKRKT